MRCLARAPPSSILSAKPFPRNSIFFPAYQEQNKVDIMWFFPNIYGLLTPHAAMAALLTAFDRARKKSGNCEGRQQLVLLNRLMTTHAAGWCSANTTPQAGRRIEALKHLSTNP
jgi:hypothetical protein